MFPCSTQELILKQPWFQKCPAEEWGSPQSCPSSTELLGCAPIRLTQEERSKLPSLSDDCRKIFKGKTGFSDATKTFNFLPTRHVLSGRAGGTTNTVKLPSRNLIILPFVFGCDVFFCHIRNEWTLLFKPSHASFCLHLEWVTVCYRLTLVPRNWVHSGKQLCLTITLLMQLLSTKIFLSGVLCKDVKWRMEKIFD